MSRRKSKAGITVQAQRLHEEAMALADEADAARAAGKDASQLFFRAFQCEWAAAQLVRLEPSRSILLRSAATLAHECNRARDAEKAIGLALSGDPPAELRRSLELTHPLLA